MSERRRHNRRSAASGEAKTPVRAALDSRSALLPLVKDGMGAIKREHHALIAESSRSAFADSLDLDAALQPGREQENRWDYLLGHLPSGLLVGLEPHSAYTSEVSRVIRKKRAAQDQLRAHLKTGRAVAHWFWVASGRVDFVLFDKAMLRLDNEGITFVGKALHDKHFAEPK